jgi:hypothetical protein
MPGRPVQFFDHTGLWMIHNTGNAPDVAHGITGELFQIAGRLSDPALRMEAHHAAWACDYTLGDHAATIEHMRRGLARKTWSTCVLLRRSRYRSVWQGNRRYGAVGVRVSGSSHPQH